MIQASGILEYGPGIRAAVFLPDYSLAKYYFSLIPKYYGAKPQKYTPHITVVRLNKELPTNLEAWGKYSGQTVSFEYIPRVQLSGLYFYLEVYSQEIGDIRLELGLPRYRQGFNCYHLTIGNRKR